MAKIAIAVMSCIPNRERRDAIRQTWFKDVPKDKVDRLFFIGLDEHDEDGMDEEFEIGDIDYLPCGDTYKDCAMKQMKAVFRMNNGQYDHVFFCDDDTFVVVDRLLNCGFEQHDYMGCPCKINAEKAIDMAHGGAGFWMSKHAMTRAEDIGIHHPSLQQTIYSDRCIGQIMHVAGVKLHGDYRFNMGKYKSTTGFCNLVPNRQNPYITTHFVYPKMMPLLHSHFEEGTRLPPNCYTMWFDRQRVDFTEKNGKWRYFIWGNADYKGEFELAQHAEFAAMEEIRVPVDGN